MIKLPKRAVGGISLTIAGTILFLAGSIMGGSPGIYIDSEGVHTAEGIIKTKDGILHQGTNTIVSYQKNTLTLEPFDSFYIHAEDADLSVTFGDSWSLEYCLPGSSTVDSYITDGILHFTAAGLSETGSGGKIYYMWLDPISWDGTNTERKYYVNLSVPKDTVFQDISLSTSNGDCKTDTLYAENDCSLHTDWGDISGKDLQAKNLDISVGNGSLDIKGSVDVQENCTIRADWGDIKLDSLSASEAALAAGNGSLTISNDLNASKNCQINADWGGAVIGNVSSPEVNIAMGNGNLTITGSLHASKSCGITADWGDIKIGSLTAPTANISLSNGDLDITETMDAPKSCLVHADWGDIEISGLLCPDAFISQNNGSLGLSVRKSTSLEISNDYGDVKLAAEGTLSDYDYSFSSAYGEIYLPGQDSVSGTAMNNRSRTKRPQADGYLQITCDNGDIKITEQ